MPEAVDLAQPARQRVPTRENLGHHFQPIFIDIFRICLTVNKVEAFRANTG